VLVVADDLDVPTALALPRLPDLMASQGLSFTRMYATQPLCGPSRASILTGQYSHNHGVYDNEPPLWGFPAFRKSEAQSLAPWLKSVGYRTSLVGKYMNGYASGAGQDYVPPGWDDWHGHLTDTEDGRYFDYWMNHNGQVVRYGSRSEDYSIDVEARLALDFIRSSAGRPEPLFMLLAPQSPHVPAKYADRYGAEFHYALAPRTPDFNEGAVFDKPSWVRQIPLLTDAQIDALDKLPRVDVIYAHANMSVDLIDAAIKNGAKGLVIAGVGDGNMTSGALDALVKAAKGGVAVVRSTRLPEGIVLRNNEVDDDKMGFVASGELNPAKSRVLLQLALTKTTDPKRIQQMFYEY